MHESPISVHAAMDVAHAYMHCALDQMLDQSIAESPEAVVPESPDEPMMPGES